MFNVHGKNAIILTRIWLSSPGEDARFRVTGFARVTQERVCAGVFLIHSYGGECHIRVRPF